MRRRLTRLMGGTVAMASVGVVGGLWPTPPELAAGGWAITVVDRFDDPMAGEDLNIGFTILQHGRTPVDVDGVAIDVVEPDGDRNRFVAQSAGEVGRYRATIELPEAGRYSWSVIQGWFGRQDLGQLDVSSPPATAWWVTGIGALSGALVVVAATAAVVMALRRRRQPEVSPKPQVSWM